ncbi:hypothetical protein D3C83_97500 [compost metagenome]
MCDRRERREIAHGGQGEDREHGVARQTVGGRIAEDLGELIRHQNQEEHRDHEQPSAEGLAQDVTGDQAHGRMPVPSANRMH